MNEKLQKAIDHLHSLYSAENNHFYIHYSADRLQEVLDEIQESIDFLESLKVDEPKGVEIIIPEYF